MSLVSFARDKLDIGGVSRPLERLSPKFLANLAVYTLTSRFYPVKPLHYPLIVMIEVGTGCNLRCDRCEREVLDPKEKNQSTPLALVKKISPMFPYVYSVYFRGLGEPFLSKTFWEIVKYIKSSGVLVGYFTNGLDLTNERIKKTFDLKVDSVLISIDSQYPQVYSKIRGGASLKRALDNTKKIIKEKKRKGLQKPDIGVSFSFQKSNIDELPDFVDFAADLGVDFLHCAALIVHKKEFISQSPYLLDQDYLEEIFSKAREKAKIRNLPLRLPKAKIEREGMCPHLFRDMYIFYNGDVCPCHSYRTKKKYYLYVENGEIVQKTINTESAVMGNLYKQDIFRIWKNRKFTSYRKAMKKGKEPSPCDKCYFRYGVH